MIKLFGTVETIGHLPCDAADVWNTVCFYEHVHTKPSRFLRTVLPIPERTTGCYGQVGDESRCLYSDGGYLAKRITGLKEGERIDFDIIEQSIRYHEYIALRGGTIRVIPHIEELCSVHMITRYELRSPLVALLRPFIVRTVSAMHRFVMRDMLARLNATSMVFAHRSSAYSASAAEAINHEPTIAFPTSVAAKAPLKHFAGAVFGRSA